MCGIRQAMLYIMNLLLWGRTTNIKFSFSALSMNRRIYIWYFVLFCRNRAWTTRQIFNSKTIHITWHIEAAATAAMTPSLSLDSLSPAQITPNTKKKLKRKQKNKKNMRSLQHASPRVHSKNCACLVCDQHRGYRIILKWTKTKQNKKIMLNEMRWEVCVALKSMAIIDMDIPEVTSHFMFVVFVVSALHMMGVLEVHIYIYAKANTLLLLVRYQYAWLTFYYLVIRFGHSYKKHWVNITTVYWLCMRSRVLCMFVCVRQRRRCMLIFFST